MSKERELLNRCAVTLKARDICPLLLKEITELLAQPEPLSEEEVIKASKYYIEGSFQFIFKKGVRWAEQQHGIGESE